MLTAVSGFIAAKVMGPYFFATETFMGQEHMVMQHSWVYLIVILGAMFAAQALGPKLAMGNTPEIGLVVGSTLMGVVLGPLLYLAYFYGAADGGNGMTLIGEALGLTTLTAVGMTGYVWTNHATSPLGSGNSRFGLASLCVDVAVVHPHGKHLQPHSVSGFVLISAGTLLFELNSIITMDTDRKVLAAVMLTLSIAVLFYNLLMLLIQLQSRD